LCKDWIRRQGDDPNGVELRKLIKNGESIPDDMAMNFLK